MDIDGQTEVRAFGSNGKTATHPWVRERFTDLGWVNPVQKHRGGLEPNLTTVPLPIT